MLLSPGTQPSPSSVCLACQDDWDATVTELPLKDGYNVSLRGVRGHETACLTHTAVDSL